MPSNRQVIAIVDFENLIACAREILGLWQYCPSFILKILDSEIGKIISEQYADCKLSWKITAFSSPRADDPRTRLDIDRVQKMAEAARQCGYIVLSVDRTKDAADFAITELGLGLLSDRDIKAVVFATNDSGISQDPQSETSFASFIRTVSRRARLHLVGFHYIPRSFGGEEEFPFSLLQDAIARRFQEIAAQRRGGHLCYQ